MTRTEMLDALDLLRERIAAGEPINGFLNYRLPVDPAERPKEMVQARFIVNEHMWLVGVTLDGDRPVTAG